MDKKVLTEILTDAINTAQLIMFENVKIFITEVLPNAKTDEEKLDLLKVWIDINIAKLESETEKGSE